jgi:hypothetical protein
MAEFFISSLQTNAPLVNRNKSLEWRLMNLSYILLTHGPWDFWNSLIFDDELECAE